MTRLLLLILLAFVSSSQAAFKYLNASAPAGGNGSDWANAYNSLATLETNLARGDTGYVGTGTYSGNITWNTPASGTTPITIKKATATDHGTDTGWNSAFAAQATFSGAQFVQTNYWVFDGQTGNGTSVSPADTTPSNYGFNFSVGDSPIIVGVASGPAVTNQIYRHIYAKADVNDIEKIFIQGANQINQVDNVSVSYCLLDGWQNGMMARGGAATYDGWVWEYNVCLNGSSTGPNHGEWINSNSAPINGMIIRYNIFKGQSGSAGMTAIIVANNSSNSNGQVYGNIFDGLRYGNGCISGSSAGNLSGFIAYNNTFMNASSDSGEWLDGPSSGNVGRNNLVYNMNGTNNNGGINGTPGSWTTDFDAFFNVTGSPTEANKQTGSGNPFTNSAAGIYSLVTNTNPGQNLGAPYNVDMLGRTRTTWSRGALEFGSAVDTTPPTVSSAAINASGNQITVTFSENIQLGVGGSGGWTLSMNGGTSVMSAPSITGNSATFNLSRVIQGGETGTISYSQPGNGWQDTAPAPNVLLSFPPPVVNVTNNSTQGPPALSSATINSAGNQIALVFSQSVTAGAGGNAGWSLSPSGGAAALSFASGTGTNTLSYNITGRVINLGESVTLLYTQPGNGIESTASGADVASITTPRAVTNNSTQGATSTPQITLPAGPYFGTQTTTITDADSGAGAVIHYTTDNSTPTGSSPVYSAPVTIATNQTIRALATWAGHLDSAPASSAYEVISWTTTTGPFKSFPVPAISGTAKWSFTVQPLTAGGNTVIGLGPVLPATNTDLAVIVEFGTAGLVRARNGANYEALNTLSWSANTLYNVSIDINMSAKTYNCTVTPQGGATVTIGTNYAFRTEQASAAQLSYFGMVTSIGTATVSNMAFPSGPSSARYIGLRGVPASGGATP